MAASRPAGDGRRAHPGAPRALLAANHVSLLDPLVLAAAVCDFSRPKVCFLALTDLFDQPLGW